MTNILLAIAAAFGVFPETSCVHGATEAVCEQIRAEREPAARHLATANRLRDVSDDLSGTRDPYRVEQYPAVVDESTKGSVLTLSEFYEWRHWMKVNGVSGVFD